MSREDLEEEVRKLALSFEMAAALAIDLSTRCADPVDTAENRFTGEAFLLCARKMRQLVEH